MREVVRRHIVVQALWVSTIRVQTHSSRYRNLRQGQTLLSLLLWLVLGMYLEIEFPIQLGSILSRILTVWVHYFLPVILIQKHLNAVPFLILLIILPSLPLLQTLLCLSLLTLLMNTLQSLKLIQLLQGRSLHLRLKHSTSLLEVKVSWGVLVLHQNHLTLPLQFLLVLFRGLQVVEQRLQ